MAILRFAASCLIVVSFVVLAAGIAPRAAQAACMCLCVDGKPHAQCPTTLEKAPICPASTCRASEAERTASPPMNETCKLVQVINPETHAIERQKVCK